MRPTCLVAARIPVPALSDAHRALHLVKVPAQQTSARTVHSSPLRHANLPRHGQPMATSHPHLIAKGELTPGIAADEYEVRRRNLLRELPEGSVAIVSGATMQYSSPGIFYRFRQRTDLFYLTGWLEPDSFLVLEKTSSKRGFRMTLYVPPSDPTWEHWHGPRSGVQGAISEFGADDAVDVALFPARLRSFLDDRNAKGPVFLDVPDHIAATQHKSTSFISRLTNSITPATSFTSPTVIKQADHDAVLHRLSSPNTITRGLRPLKPVVEPLRLIKSEAEIALLHRAADISAHGHAKAMSFAEAGRSEAQVTAIFEHDCVMQGATRSAFVPVCASGDVALTMHYTANNRLLEAGKLVLFDAGCEYGGYSADLTRTFPVSGRFTDPQRDLYAAVLSATKQVAELCTAAEALSLRGLHRRSVEALRKELAQLGVKLNAGDLERRLYPHFAGHYLGIDVHDTPTCDRSLRLQPGMVLAIEPGLYVPYDDTFPKHFQGLAIRIEDEVVVRQDDNLHLSANAPREIVDVEATCQRLFDR